MKPKDIFGLAVRLLGLVFLYLGLKDLAPAVKQLIDLAGTENPDRDDVIYALISGPLPLVLNLAISWWLLRSRILIRWAYPHNSTVPEPSPLPQMAVSVPESIPAPRLTNMERAEEKLAALVEKPHGTHPV